MKTLEEVVREELRIIKSEFYKLDPPEWGGPDLTAGYAAIRRIEARLRRLESNRLGNCVRCGKPIESHALTPESSTPRCADGRSFATDAMEWAERVHALLFDGDGSAQRRYSEGWERTFGRLGGK